jgi:hypothetical protein
MLWVDGFDVDWSEQSRLCFWCYRDLPAGPGDTYEEMYWRCPCGVSYSWRLLMTMAEELWVRILQRDRCVVVRSATGGIDIVLDG